MHWSVGGHNRPHVASAIACSCLRCYLYFVPTERFDFWITYLTCYQVLFLNATHLLKCLSESYGDMPLKRAHPRYVNFLSCVAIPPGVGGARETQHLSCLPASPVVTWLMAFGYWHAVCCTGVSMAVSVFCGITG